MLALALTTAQIAELKTIATPLPRPLRTRYLQMLGAVLAGRSSVGDGELSRLAHGIAQELLAPPSRQPQASGESVLRRFGVSP
jgi:hypothetical protein